MCSDLNCELKEKEINKKKHSSIQHARKTYGKSKLRNVEQGRHNEQIWNEQWNLRFCHCYILFHSSWKGSVAEWLAELMIEYLHECMRTFFSSSFRTFFICHILHHHQIKHSSSAVGLANMKIILIKEKYFRERRM